jgi:hypothetical protein
VEGVGEATDYKIHADQIEVCEFGEGKVDGGEERRL